MITVGDVLQGRYRILGELGKGGIGVIFLAEDQNLQKKVVVKKVRENFVDSNLETRAEVNILKNLHHQYLPQVYDFVQNNRDVYTVIDYIDGRDLQKYLDAGVRFPEATLVRWLLELLDVLEYLHGQSPPVYHCDIKPANIIVTAKNDVCLIDFNISLGDGEKKLTGLSQWYCAPEQKLAAAGQFNVRLLDGRMDLYSLAATFYSIMTFHFPNEENGSVWTEECRKLYSDGFLEILSRALSVDRKKRFRTAADMRQALLHTEKWDAFRRKVFRMRLLIYSAGVLMLTVGGCMTAYGAHRQSVEEWNSRVNDFYELCEKGEEEDVITEGIALLNASSGSHMTEKQKETILSQVGDAYYLDGDYKEAAEYYSAALELDPENEQFCLDYAIALIRGGDLDKAGRFIRKLKRRGLEDEEIALVEAEMQLLEGDAAGAYEAAAELKKASSDREFLFRVSCLAAESAETCGDTKSALSWYQEADHWQTDRGVLRQIVRLASAMSEESADGTDYQELALSCAEEICRNWPDSVTDRINLAIAQSNAGETEEAVETLTELYGEEEEDYRIPMYLAYFLYREDREKGDYSRFCSYYEDAQELFRYFGNSADGEEQQIMEYLKSIYDSLKTEGGAG